jgi:hypothetical protein
MIIDDSFALILQIISIFTNEYIHYLIALLIGTNYNLQTFVDTPKIVHSLTPVDKVQDRFWCGTITDGCVSFFSAAV